MQSTWERRVYFSISIFYCTNRAYRKSSDVGAGRLPGCPQCITWMYLSSFTPLANIYTAAMNVQWIIPCAASPLAAHGNSGLQTIRSMKYNGKFCTTREPLQAHTRRQTQCRAAFALNIFAWMLLSHGFACNRLVGSEMLWRMQIKLKTFSLHPSFRRSISRGYFSISDKFGWKNFLLCTPVVVVVTSTVAAVAVFVCARGIFDKIFIVNARNAGNSSAIVSIPHTLHCKRAEHCHNKPLPLEHTRTPPIVHFYFCKTLRATCGIPYAFIQ